MQTKLTKLFVITFGLLLSATLAVGQTGSIRGKVIGKDGEPLKGALVRIERLDVRGNYKVKTRKKGNYFHAGLPLGTYRVTVEIDGEPVDRVQGVRVGMGDPTEVNFDLTRLAERQQKGPTQADLAAMSPEERKRYEEALKKRQQQISKNKELNEAFNAGMVALKMNNYAQAVEGLQKAAEIDPEQHVVWANLANAQSQLARQKTGQERPQTYQSAIESYNKAIELEPTNAAYHNNLGLVLVRMGKTDEGKQKLAEAAMLDPENAAKYYFNLGAVMINTGNAQGAIDAFKKATEADPNYANAHYQLGMALVGAAETRPDGSVIPAPGTIEAFKKYLELEPNGQFAASAQSMVQGLTATVETEYEDPDKKKKKS